MINQKIDYREIIGFFPIYIKDIGNCTMVLMSEEDVILEIPVLSFLKKMARYYFLDLDQIRKQYGNILGIKNLVPIPLGKSIFIPIKSRKPKFKNDGAMGYLDLDSIEKLIKKEEGTEILLKNNKTYHSVANYRTIIKHFKNGHIIKKLSNIYINEEVYNYPATKGDIELILKEVNSIKNAIK